MELEVIRHLWVAHDNDLVDLTLTTQTAVSQGKSARQSRETVHTNKKHPFLTVEEGFVPVAQLKLGMHIVEAGGRVGEVTGWENVSGAQTMYNLEVTQDHTYVVGDGQWVVHNSCINGKPLEEIWHEGSRGSSEESAMEHFSKHGDDPGVNANSMEQYVRKAQGFNNNLRGARTADAPGFIDNAVKYMKDGRYIIKAPDGRILSYGSKLH